jgi:hypothetical protein
MKQIIESDLEVIDILEFIIKRNEKTDSWNEVINDNSNLVFQRFKSRNSGALINQRDLIPANFIKQSTSVKFSGILSFQKNQVISLNLAVNSIILIPPETSIRISDRNYSAPIINKNKNEWIVLKLTANQFLKFANNSIWPIMLLLFVE